MQRAAATSPKSSPNSPQTPSSEPTSKRRRLDTPSQITPSGTPVSSSYNDRSAPVAASKAEADAQSAARARNFREGGETEWILDLGLPGANTGAAPVEATRDDEGEESYDEDIWSNQNTGRQTYGSFKRKSMRESLKTNTSGMDDDDDELSSLSGSESVSSDGSVSMRKRTQPDSAISEDKNLRKQYSKARHGLGNKRKGLQARRGRGEASGPGGFEGSSKKGKKKKKDRKTM